MLGVVRVGDVCTTKVVPVPVWEAIDVALPTEVIGPVKLALVVTLPAVNPAAVPVTFVMTPDAGVPSAGVTSAGLVANTKAPVPVSPVTAAARLALDGVARKVATPVPSPLTPVLIGRPVAFVRTPAEGVPIFGVVSVGLACITNVVPVPVCAAIAVAFPEDVIGPVRFALVVTVPAVNPAAVPVTFVITPDDGVPKAGVTSEGLVALTGAPDPVAVVQTGRADVPPPTRMAVVAPAARV